MEGRSEGQLAETFSRSIAAVIEERYVVAWLLVFCYFSLSVAVDGLRVASHSSEEYCLCILEVLDQILHNG
jgi:hypothetical protein